MCLKHTAKLGLHTAKALPCVAHDKSPTATKHRQRPSLPWVFCRAHGKVFAVCKTRLSAKKESWRRLMVTRTLLCVTTLDTQQRGNLCRVPEVQNTRQRVILCRVSWLLHTAKSFTRPAWYDFFAVCYGLCTRQSLEKISVFFVLSRIWYLNHFSNTYISKQSSHAFHIAQSALQAMYIVK